MDTTILQILAKHGLVANDMFIVAMREAYQAGATSVASIGGDDDEPGGLSAADVANLTSLGIDPHKKFTLRNSTFTIVGFKPSRWKFPISAQTQNGTRYKFTVAQVKQYQSGR